MITFTRDWRGYAKGSSIGTLAATLEAGFAQAQEQNGMLEIVSIDGAPVVWGACCGGH